MSRPRIVVTAACHRGRTMTLLNRLAVWRAGGTPVVLRPTGPPAEVLASLDAIDGVVVGGGDDIDVSLYSDGPELETRIDPDRDALELALLDLAAARGLPVLGICRGAQMLNVHLGGTLLRDIHAVYEEAPRMRTVLPRKCIHLAPDSRLRGLLRTDSTVVNALHHQAVDRLGRGLRVAARDEYGIVQAIEAFDAPLRIGVQWHPEWLFYQGRQRGLFQALVATARGAPLQEAAAA